LAQDRLSRLLVLEIASGGRPQIEAELRALIRLKSMENPLSPVVGARQPQQYQRLGWVIRRVTFFLIGVTVRVARSTVT